MEYRKANRLMLVGMLSVTGAALSTTPAFAQGCNAEFARDFLAGWSHNLPRLVPLMAENVVYEDKTVHVVAHGKDEFKAFAEMFFKVYPDLTFSLSSAIPAGDHLVIEWVATGTQKGDLPGMPASNKVATVAGASIMECENGKIKRNTDYWDNATVMQQLGFLAAASK